MTERPRWSPGLMRVDRRLVARGYRGRFAMMAAAILLGPGTAQAGLFGSAGAIIGHAGRGGRNWRGDDCYRRSLDDNLRRRRRRGNIGGSVAGFLGGFVGGSAAADNK